MYIHVQAFDLDFESARLVKIASQSVCLPDHSWKVSGNTLGVLTECSIVWPKQLNLKWAIKSLEIN